VGVAEFSTDLDGREVGTKVVALGKGARPLQIQLRRFAVRISELIEEQCRRAASRSRTERRTIGFGVALVGPLRTEGSDGRGGRLDVAATRQITAEVRVGVTIFDLAGARDGEIPGIPGGRKDVLSAENEAANGVDGTANGSVEAGHAGTRFN